MTLHLSPASLIARNKRKQKEWPEAHPERVRAFHIKHNAREETKQRKIQCARDNREHINARRREQYRQRKQTSTDPPEATTEEPGVTTS